MPPVSQAQRKAMWAAASGHSTLGIPQKVGKDFAEADTGGKLPARVKSGGAKKQRGVMGSLKHGARYGKRPARG